jgi:hypothetical protein
MLDLIRCQVSLLYCPQTTLNVLSPYSAPFRCSHCCPLLLPCSATPLPQPFPCSAALTSWQPISFVVSMAMDQPIITWKWSVHTSFNSSFLYFYPSTTIEPHIYHTIKLLTWNFGVCMITVKARLKSSTVPSVFFAIHSRPNKLLSSQRSVQPYNLTSTNSPRRVSNSGFELFGLLLTRLLFWHFVCGLGAFERERYSCRNRLRRGDVYATLTSDINVGHTNILKQLTGTKGLQYGWV